MDQKWRAGVHLGWYSKWSSGWVRLHLELWFHRREFSTRSIRACSCLLYVFLRYLHFFLGFIQILHVAERVALSRGFIVCE
jgi:hypothetical protein